MVKASAATLIGSYSLEQLYFWFVVPLDGAVTVSSGPKCVWFLLCLALNKLLIRCVEAKCVGCVREQELHWGK